MSDDEEIIKWVETKSKILSALNIKFGQKSENNILERRILSARLCTLEKYDKDQFNFEIDNIIKGKI